jgi:hypothetical protein
MCLTEVGAESEKMVKTTDVRVFFLLQVPRFLAVTDDIVLTLISIASFSATAFTVFFPSEMALKYLGDIKSQKRAR